MKIYQITPFYKVRNYNKSGNNDNKSSEKYSEINLLPKSYNDYMLSFEARVDKGLERFYNVNKDRMPETVRTYIENLDDKSKYTPLEAQKNAFELLEISQSIEYIQSAYPEEPLFDTLRNPTDSRATRGILNSVRENNELLELYDQGVLKDKSNLTVYLIKKIFLENKTIAEINEDLDKDLNEDFKTDFKSDNSDARYIYPSTLTSLGIKVPEFEYRQSLRYTVDGYSDYVGNKISEFWNNLPIEERTARNKKSVQEFEAWWTSLSRNEILDLIATQTSELDMLKQFKKFQRDEAKKEQSKTEEQEKKLLKHSPRKHIRVGSTLLAKDEFFIKWATNNLKLYQERMTEAEKDSLHIRRMQHLVTRWAEMTAAERTDYISKMKAGSEPLKFTMIDAWNNSIDIIKDLSQHLKENQIYKPTDLLYSTQEFSEFQSEVMTEFWQNNPQYADKLGYNIRQSQIKVQTAIVRGTFEELKRQILRNKADRIKELAQYKINQRKELSQNTKEQNVNIGYMQDFKNTYCSALGGHLKNLPQNYINDYFKVIENDFTQEQVEAWTKHLKGQPISDYEKELLVKISQTESDEGARINRALEGALAAILYECTESPEVYKLSFSDLKVALYQIDRGEKKIVIGSHKLQKQFEFPIIKRKIDKARINALYNKFVEPLSEDKLDKIAHEYFISLDNESLLKYLKTYGKTLNIIFSDKSGYPLSVKANMLEKLSNNAPSDVRKISKCLIDSKSALKQEDKIKHIKFLISKRFSFVPSIYMDKFISELGVSLRKSSSLTENYDNIKLACQKRSDIKSIQKLFILPKADFSVSNALSTLAMEEVLADVLYDITDNVQVYGLQFEELCDNLEIFNMVKKFPSEKRSYVSPDGTNVELIAKKRPNLSGLQQQYIDYRNEIADWVNSDVKNDNAMLQDLVFILNPDENMPQKDELVIERIKRFGLNLKELLP